MAMWMRTVLMVVVAGVCAQARGDGEPDGNSVWIPMFKDSPDAFKVRLSLKAALGDEAYAWNENELYLFKASIAYAMRQYYAGEKGQQVNFTSEDVVTYKETQRISFFFYVTDPGAVTTRIIPKAEVEAAVRLSRGRINSAFLLSDDTLEFEGLLATMAPPKEPGVEVWLIVFGVIMGLVACVGAFLIFSGIRDRQRKPSKEDDEEKAEESQKEGKTNLGLEEEEEENDSRTKL